jgi:exopolysaccharide biosynthesis polyprenyl glycosylphosphotransferase
MNRRNDIRTGFLVMAGDILAVNAGFLFSYWLRFSSGLFPVFHGIPHVREYYRLLPVLTLILIFLLRSNKMYSFKARLSIVDEFFNLVKSVTIGIFILMAGTFLYREYSFSRGMLLLSWFLLILFLGSWRFFVNRVRLWIRKRGQNRRNLLIVGSVGLTGRLIEHISGDPHWDYEIKGVLSSDGAPPDLERRVPVLGRVDDLSAVIDRHDIDEVILTDTSIPRPEIVHVIMECEKKMVEFRLVADLLGMVTSQVDMRTIDGIPFLGLKESPLTEGYNRFLKRSMDIMISAAGLLLMLPTFFLAAGIIRLITGRSVFYLQKRIGEDGRRFSMFKFRTMVENAEKGVGISMTRKNDPRRTRIGSFLRRYNLDELPQLINVLKGEMSLVGPRPERPRFVGRFKEDIPRYMARHKIRSGVTGWAQVNGLRGETSIEERTKYDIYYIENWSLAFDLKILLMSVFAFKNAY